jgi:hypothetical protein
MLPFTGQYILKLFEGQKLRNGLFQGPPGLAGAQGNQGAVGEGLPGSKVGKYLSVQVLYC